MSALAGAPVVVLALGPKWLDPSYLITSLVTAMGPWAVAVLCLAFPLHPPGKPETSRIAELDAVALPTLVVQGARGRALVGVGQTPAERKRRREAAIRLFVNGYRPPACGGGAAPG